jgi:hypothetical protein
MACLSQPAAAADVSLDGQLEQRFEYNDNIDLSSTAPEETAASVTTPSIRFQVNTPSSQTILDASFDLGRFSNDSRYNYEDTRATLSTSLFGQRSEVGLRAEATNLSTLESEETDTGQINSFGRKFDLSAMPYFSYEVTQRSSIRLDGLIQSADYSDTLLLEDYRTHGAGFGYLYQLSEIDSLGTRLEYRHFENEDSPGNESDIYSGFIVWTRDISERLVSEFSAGPQYTEQTNTAGSTTQETDNWGIALNGNLDWWATEQAKLKFGLSRSVEPSGVGNTVERDRASFGVSYRATELVALRLNSYYQQDNRVGNLGGLDRDYFTASPSLHWQFSRNWELSTGYRYRWQQFNSLDTATSNMAFISISVKTSGWNFAD